MLHETADVADALASMDIMHPTRGRLGASEDTMTHVARESVERLRHDIDSGRTADKIRAPDPALAPLGTDEEAAGTPVDSARAAEARRIETSGPPMVPERHASLGHPWIIVAIVLILAALLVAAGLSLRT
jgi:hypothetical protein